MLQPPALGVTEGGTAEIPCNHSISGSNTLFWYQHRPGGSPEPLISGYNTNETIGRFSMHIAENRLSTTLRIRGAGVRDAAAYYCAVRDTVRGSEGKPAQKELQRTADSSGSVGLWRHLVEYLFNTKTNLQQKIKTIYGLNLKYVMHQ